MLPEISFHFVLIGLFIHLLYVGPRSICISSFPSKKISHIREELNECDDGFVLSGSADNMNDRNIRNMTVPVVVFHIV